MRMSSTRTCSNLFGRKVFRVAEDSVLRYSVRCLQLGRPGLHCYPHNVFRNAISAFLSSGERSSPNS
jgi:hypothetical protein